MRFEWPLTGRAEELRLIGAALLDAHSSGIVVCGPAGVGKSRVVREALDSVASTGWETRWAVGTSSARTLPLGAFASWAEADSADNLHLISRVIEALTASDSGAPLAVGVDDAHLLDDLSAFVLHQVVQRGAAKVVATVRDGEHVPAAIQEIWKVGEFMRLDLQPLSRDESTMLLSATLGESLDPDTVERLWKLARGNVLYLRTIVEQEVADGRLAAHRGYWRWAGDPVIAPDLVEAIESRIGALPPEVSDVVDVLAIGEPLELNSLTRITDSAAVEEADVRGLIALDDVEGRVEVRVAHPLYGEIRRKRAPATRLRRLRGLVAAELGTGADCDHTRMVVRRAALMLDSDHRPDPDLLVRAAQGAVWLADLPLADRLADAAIRAGAAAEAYFVRSHVLDWLNRGREADEVLAACPTEGLTDEDRATLTYLRANNMLWVLGDPAAAKKLIDEAPRTIPRAHRGCIDAFLTVYWAAMNQPDLARESLKNLVLEELPGIVCAETASVVVSLYAGAGRTADAVSAADHGYAIISRSYDAPLMRFILADSHVRALWLAGRIAEACDVAHGLRRQAADLPGGAQLLSAAVEALSALATGHPGRACSLLKPAVELLSALGDFAVAYQYAVPYAHALAMSGSIEEAVAVLDRLERNQNPGRQYLNNEMQIAKAWVAAAEGAATKAISILSSAAEVARSNGQFAIEVLMRQTATQFGDRSNTARLRELASLVEGPRACLAARFAAALGAGDGAELSTVSAEFESMGDLIAAVDAAAQAAIAYRRQGLRGSALACSARAEALAEQCGVASTPLLRKAAERLPLTDREYEIVMLIAEGLSNREVADLLTLSTRTVEGHVYRVMAKTGVSSREELRFLLPKRRQRPA